MVLHLLDTGSPDDFPSDFPNVRETLKEAQRVTTSGGGLIFIITCLPSTISNKMWMSQLNEDLTVRFNKRNPSIEQFDDMFKANGMECIQKINILGTVSKQYFNFEGPLQEDWRKTSSYWQLATEKELEDVKQKILELKSLGQLETWARERDHSDTSGILTLLICKSK